MFPIITDVIIDPCKHLWAVRSCIICEVELWADAHVRYTYRAENDSHFGTGEPHFSRHYLSWFNDTRGDKGDGLK